MIALLKHADMSSSYKPALLLAIVRCVGAGKVTTHRLQLTDIAAQYLAMYWTQVIVFRLRHSARDAAQPVIVRLIRSAADALGIRKLTDMPSEAHTTLIRAIERVLPVNVLDAFHRSRPDGMAVVYDWQKSQRYIELAKGAETFIVENASALTVIATYFWARYLSGLNATPHIVEKLDPILPARSSLVRFARMLSTIGERDCFYCGEALHEKDRPATIDHFIPWTFVHEDKLWNLVLSCNRCNASKSDGLPSEELLGRLIKLNKLRATISTTKPASFMVTERAHAELTHLYGMAQDEGWPQWRRIHGFSN